MIDALRCLALDYPDWTKALAAVEFAYNNSVNPSTTFSPFFLCYGENPPTPATLNFHRLARTNPNQASVDFAKVTQEAVKTAQARLEEAAERQKQYADEHRRDLSFAEGDLVYLSTEKLPLAGPRKLLPRWFGPCKVEKKIGDLAYQLKLPQNWRQHNVFHVSRLKPYEESNRFLGRSKVRPPPDLEYGPDVYEIEEILDRRERKAGRWTVVDYLIKWQGYPMHEATWESKKQLADAGSGVQEMLLEADNKLTRVVQESSMHEADSRKAPVASTSKTPPKTTSTPNLRRSNRLKGTSI